MIRTRVFALVTAFALALAACGGEAKTAPPSASSSVAPSSAPASDVVEIKVSVTDGKVEPGPSVHKVALGRTVRIIVTSDRADEVHVHGYDKEAKVGAGTPTTIQFTADQSGRFEVETHESGLQLLQLQVS
jgi:plastocyanin